MKLIKVVAKSMLLLTIILNTLNLKILPPGCKSIWGVFLEEKKHIQNINIEKQISVYRIS